MLGIRLRGWAAIVRRSLLPPSAVAAVQSLDGTLASSGTLTRSISKALTGTV